MRNHPMFGLFLAAAGALVLTPDTLFMRLSGMDAFPMLAWRGLLMGGALLVAWLMFGGPDRKAQLLALGSVAGMVVIGLQVSNAVLFNSGIAYAPVPVVLFGVATAPVFSAIAAYVMAGERSTPATAVTIALVMLGIGIALFSKGEGGLTLDRASLFGALCGLGVAIAFSITFVILRTHQALAILPTIGLGALLAGCVGLLFSETDRLFSGEVWAIAVSGGVILPVSFFLITLSTRHTHPSNVSLFLLLETVLGPAWVWIGIGERPTPAMLLGGLIVVVSLAIYLLHERRRSLRGIATAAPAG